LRKRRSRARRKSQRNSSSASEVATTGTRWLDPVTGATHESEMRRSVSDNGPTGSDGVPSDTTEDDWSRGSVEDPDEVPSPSSSPSPSPAEPPEHTGPITELDRKVSECPTFTYDAIIDPIIRGFELLKKCILHSSQAVYINDISLCLVMFNNFQQNLNYRGSIFLLGTKLRY